ncbi:MAG: multicopper oxidase domain-containing protein [Candidatus Acidiferrales bacterium]
MSQITRRTFIAEASAALAGSLTGAALASGFPAWTQAQTAPQVAPSVAPNVQLEIAPLALEIAPRKIIHTVAYNGRVPGPLIRWPEGKPIVIDVLNRSAIPEIVHWHGVTIPSAMDGASEEGSPMIAPGAQFRYAFTPQPAGFRWYHTHAFAGHDLKRGTYSGQFGCFYIEPRDNPGALSQKIDQEIFLALHDWNAYMSSSGDSSMEAAYDYSTINGRMLGFGDPLRVREGQRVLLHILNASASMIHWLALAGHELTVIAMDGNPVPTPATVRALRLAPAERIDAIATMNQPGVWILGETREPLRKIGMGIVVEYANRQEKPKWIEPPETLWDYRQFAVAQPASRAPDEIIPLRFESKFHGQGAFDSWTINGKSYPEPVAPPLRQGKRYRLRMANRSADDHPLHLHRHTFEVSRLDGAQLSGLNKDVLVVPANSTAEVDFVANNPGPTLFHCHNQTHMDFGFMTLFRYS